jgi:initiation factor 1A
MYQSIISSGKKRTYRSSKKKTEAIWPDEDQKFAVVKELLGNGRLNALCEDSVTRMGRIRGSMRSGPKKVIISKGDLIIVALRDYEDKVDVVHRYTHEEASSIIRRYQMPDFIVRSWNMDEYEQDNEKDSVIFAEEEDVLDIDNI